ncbi:hypothetical protein [Halovivax sp.]|uniref:hypothetical protein n=1 Tax=Halovivax sp. TaxID=1935978 RepID=UPI0025C68787|nr:hypothetical protein [Halovivax sp.]
MARGARSTARRRRRALAALRIAIGLLILADPAMRARDLTAFYTDAGVLPRAAHAEAFPVLASLSIHARFGSPRAQALLVATAGVLALVAGFLFGAVGWQAAVVADADVRIGGDDGLDPGEHARAMFAPNPPEAEGWYVAPAELESGERVDAVRGGAVSWDRPPDVAETYPSALWHRYLFDLRNGSDAEYERLGAHLCAAADDEFDQTVLAVESHNVEEPVVLDGESEPEPSKRYALDCSTAR